MWSHLLWQIRYQCCRGTCCFHHQDNGGSRFFHSLVPVYQSTWHQIPENLEYLRSHVVMPLTCLWDSSRCFMSTATTTLTRTNWAMRTKITKKIGAMTVDTQQLRTQSASSSQSSRSVSFIMPFQLSPVATRNNVRNAIPKLLKWACSPRPWHGYFSLHSGWNSGHSYSWHEKHILNTFTVIIISFLTLLTNSNCNCF